jgi:DNA-binding response OmpR family regulator
MATRVLVVDDDRDTTDSLATLLRFAGYEVAVAYRGEEALTVCDGESPPQVVLLDLQLPDVDGLEVCRMLRRRRRATIRIIALTGWGRAVDRERTAEAGFDEHLLKPVSIEALLAVMRR